MQDACASIRIFEEMLHQIEASLLSISSPFQALDLFFWVANLSARPETHDLRVMRFKSLAIAFPLIQTDLTFYKSKHRLEPFDPDLDIEWIRIGDSLRLMLMEERLSLPCSGGAAEGRQHDPKRCIQRAGDHGEV